MQLGGSCWEKGGLRGEQLVGARGEQLVVAMGEQLGGPREE